MSFINNMSSKQKIIDKFDKYSPIKYIKNIIFGKKDKK